MYMYMHITWNQKTTLCAIFARVHQNVEGCTCRNGSGEYVWASKIFMGWNANWKSWAIRPVLSLSCSSNGRATVIHRRCVCWLLSCLYKSKGLSCIESFEIPVHTCSKLNSMLTSSCCSLVCYETHLLHLEGLFRWEVSRQQSIPLWVLLGQSCGRYTSTAVRSIHIHRTEADSFMMCWTYIAGLFWKAETHPLHLHRLSLSRSPLHTESAPFPSHHQTHYHSHLSTT